MVKEIDSSLENKKKPSKIVWKVISVIMFVVVLVGLAILLSRDDNPSSPVVEKASSAVTTDNNVSVVSEGNMVYFELAYAPWVHSVDNVKILMQAVSKWEKENSEKQVMGTSLINVGANKLGVLVYYR